jgi:hypothetical protein
MRTIWENSSIFRSGVSAWLIGELAKSSGEVLALVMGGVGKGPLRQGVRGVILENRMGGLRGGKIANTWLGSKDISAGWKVFWVSRPGAID